MPTLESSLEFKRDNRIYQLLAAVAVFLGATFVLLSLTQLSQSRIELVWFMPASQFFFILAGGAIAYLSLARSFFRRETFFLTISVGFWVSSIISFLSILVWPGLLGASSILLAGKAVPHYFYLLGYSMLLIALIAGVFHNHDNWRDLDKYQVTTRGMAWMFAATAVTLALSLLILSFHDLLPQTGGGEFPGAADYPVALLSAGAVGSYVYSYSVSQKRIDSYLAVFSLLLFFMSISSIRSAGEYDFWWYGSLALQMVAFAVVLFGMMEQYVELQGQQQQLDSEVEALSDASQDIANTLDLERLANSVLYRSLRLTTAQYGFFDLLNEDNELEMVAIEGVPAGACEVALAERRKFYENPGLARWVAGNGQPILTNSPKSDPRTGEFPPGHLPIDSFLGVPVKSRNKTTGVIALANKPGGFTAADERAVSALASQAAVAVDNARLYEKIDKELQRKIKELEGLAEASKALAEAVDSSQVYTSAAEIAERLFHTKAIWITRYNEGTGFIETRAYRGPMVEEFSKLVFRPGKGIAGLVFSTGESMFVPDLQKEPRFQNKVMAESAGITSMFCVPISGKSGPIGTINLYIPGLSTDNPPESSQLDLLLAYSSQLAVAVERAELYEDQRQEIEDLEALQLLSDTAMGEVEPSLVLAQVLKRSVEAMHANAGALFFIDETGSVLRSRETYNLGEKTGERPIVLRRSEGLAGRVVLEKRPIRVMDAMRDPFMSQSHVRERMIHSMIGAPLFSGGKVIGAIELGRLDIRYFTDHDERLLRLIADKVAIANERVRYYQGLQQINAQLIVANTRLQNVVDGMPEGIILIDSGGATAMTNKAAEELLHHPIPSGIPVRQLGEFLGLRTNSGERIDPNQLPFVRAFSGEVTTGNEMVVKRDGTVLRYIICNAAPLASETGKITGVVAVMQDVSRLKEIDQLKDDFISIASHELKNPLTAIKGHLQLVEKSSRDIQQERRSDSRHIRIVSEQADRMARLINDLLDASRIQAGRLALDVRRMNLTETIFKVVEEAQATSSSHEILFIREGSPIVGEWDADRLTQVMHNLISNAIKYSPQGGKIEITVSKSQAEAVVSVKDSGPGIPPEQRELIFDRFYRVQAQHGATAGMGLGLFICREIVTHHGGRIWVESEEGQGSTFVFTLPGARTLKTIGD
ncbi:MAG: GAF domain-containing protein [Chloroflexi bacterium]|nr:GAF domain-containing protein [Chloroflexota bacterium]